MVETTATATIQGMENGIESRYTLGRTIAYGRTAKVKIAVKDGVQYALKIFRVTAPTAARIFQFLKQEINFGKELDNPYIVKYHECCEDAMYTSKRGRTERCAYVVEDYIEGYQLFNYVAHTGAFSEPMCRFFFKQILAAVNHIHSKNHSHRDLKLDNILYDIPQNQIKVVDFGCSAPLSGRDGSGQNTTVIGDYRYMPPEMIAGLPYQGHVYDLFSIGVGLFFLRAGVFPFNMATAQDNAYKLLVNNRADLFWQLHQSFQEDGYYSDEFKDLLSCMFNPEPSMRLQLADILFHSWLNAGPVATEEEV